MAHSFLPTSPRVLAVASHVTHGYVGNKMVTTVMQALGCDVSAIDTVHFSNHTGYGQFRGRKVPASEIQDIWQGLRGAGLVDFDAMLTGYCASAEVVETVGKIAHELREAAAKNPGSFFWTLDPVMGDEGRLYVHEAIPPVYRSLLPEADLILPNTFEAELLSETTITGMPSLIDAITKLHVTYKVPHIVVTSLHISRQSGRRNSNSSDLIVIGSSCRSDFTPRPFSVTIPALPAFFSGPGDMFAALILVRLREAVAQQPGHLLSTRSWRSPDSVAPADLPLAQAAEKTLRSMHAVLSKTMHARDAVLKQSTGSNEGLSEAESERINHLRLTKAGEVRVVQCADDLRHPPSPQEVRIVAEEVRLDRYRDK